MKTKKTVAMILAVMMLSVLPLAFSAEETSSSTTVTSSTLCTPGSNGAGGQRQARMGQSAAMGSNAGVRAGMLEKRSQMMQNRANNLGASAQSLQLCAQIDKAIAAIQASGSTLPAETLAQIQTYKTQVVALHDELVATRGDIRDLMTKYREFRQSKDYDSMTAIFDQITALQTLRAEKIAAINDLLSKILALLPTA